jgi:hypothetical protein
LPREQSKNGTQRNQTFKAHRNGIKRAKANRARPLKGVSA